MPLSSFQQRVQAELSIARLRHQKLNSIHEGDAYNRKACGLLYVRRRMQDLERQRTQLRAALATLVGASTAKELDELLAAIAIVPGDADTKAAAITGITALRDTLPKEGGGV